MNGRATHDRRAAPHNQRPAVPTAPGKLLQLVDAATAAGWTATVWRTLHGREIHLRLEGDPRESVLARWQFARRPGRRYPEWRFVEASYHRSSANPSAPTDTRLTANDVTYYASQRRGVR